MAYSARDLALAAKAKAHGGRYCLRIILEARKAGIPISLGFALLEQESSDRVTSGARNVFGHDKGKPFAGAGKVTQKKYLEYKKIRGPKGHGGMQGVGPAQLTWWELQDKADRLGGSWVPRYNIQVAFARLAELIDRYGENRALAAYNAGESNWRDGINYAQDVRRRQKKWHDRLT
jgi:hypothetical protein